MNLPSIPRPVVYLLLVICTIGGPIYAVDYYSRVSSGVILIPLLWHLDPTIAVGGWIAMMGLSLYTLKGKVKPIQTSLNDLEVPIKKEAELAPAEGLNYRRIMDAFKNSPEEYDPAKPDLAKISKAWDNIPDSKDSLVSIIEATLRRGSLNTDIDLTLKMKEGSIIKFHDQDCEVIKGTFHITNARELPKLEAPPKAEPMPLQ